MNLIIDIRAWDIIAELVKLCTYPPPLNPFAVDFAYFDDLEPHEKYLASGAMVNFLQRVVLASSDDKQYIAKGIPPLPVYCRNREPRTNVCTSLKVSHLSLYIVVTVNPELMFVHR